MDMFEESNPYSFGKTKVSKLQHFTNKWINCIASTLWHLQTNNGSFSEPKSHLFPLPFASYRIIFTLEQQDTTHTHTQTHTHTLIYLNIRGSSCSPDTPGLLYSPKHTHTLIQLNSPHRKTHVNIVTRDRHHWVSDDPRESKSLACL